MKWSRLLLRSRGRHRAGLLTRWRRHLGPAQPDPPVTAVEAAEARRCSEESLAEAQARDLEVQSVSAELRRQRTENHFSALIARAMRETR
ncbi:DUF7620 family protein [Nocardiopsis terrae]